MAARAPGSILLIGASRGLGLALAEAFLEMDWSVVATARSAVSPLHALASDHPTLEIEMLDITDGEQVRALAERLSDRRFDCLFINAGVADAPASIADTPLDDFTRLMATNAWAPLQVVEALGDRVAPSGVIGVMSSGQGSIANNNGGGVDAYRASKAALNMLMRGYAARRADDPRGLLLLAPGWIRTDLGGPDAPHTIEDSIPKLIKVILAQKGRPGLHYLDRDGRPVPW
ncbi:NAD(P)-dependent dehydrogenase (short-subunit alcohol dehydrogenase family) [Brevundimonas vesicularis]|uniref:NAD(P)-dependent dehydrogenase (Short-subunit alcohol dehydrogenase family) n=1 Tax=Brevundimonas vesicularis TaxID=41276 RepID=A0A7W9L611_BREVE|nr:SDR family NAD(P)-dependent oxidoreductase [Brevundimonas vesicularis]MBB5771899.1 NAD(P)-dependent dehydrogenase (short-subunit alcohol dehydrogenase family) [Brevundimonas vesicularis]